MSDAQRIANLDAWLETMRGPDGYGGPVVHWWQHCLSYTGAGLDWRYEGIISGYLALWRRTGQAVWLEKARRAGDDLLRGQLPSGNYRHSNFEQNPYSGGTPHEAAADLGLLRLAGALREASQGDWEAYERAAEANLRCYAIERLWDDEAGAFRDSPDVPSLVPNKACTLAEALFAWAELRGADEPIERYALPTLHAVVSLQVQDAGRLAGAIPQNTLRGTVVEAYFPYYIARCIPALLRAHQLTGEARWLDAATAAGEFILRHIEDDALPQVLYPRGMNRYPQWRAALGDILRALELLQPYGLTAHIDGLAATLRGACLPSGGVATARGFAAQISQHRDPAAQPDFRDPLPAAGWVDKAFAWLAGLVPGGQPLPPPQTAEVLLDCTAAGRPARWRETAQEMTLTAGGRTLYHWRKGEPWARVVAPEVMAR
ncbi:MAG: hypothetical protein IAE85_11350 [Anaerolinea sp.]|nr:hypothetical protein [Anaerolinea sp.]